MPQMFSCCPLVLVSCAAFCSSKRAEPFCVQVDSAESGNEASSVYWVVSACARRVTAVSTVEQLWVSFAVACMVACGGL